MLRRTRDQADRRRVGLELTEHGQRVLRSARSRRTAWLAARLKRLTPEELDAIDRVIDPLSRLLDEEPA
jgi:DNA-binding MarR family transcriptional regulator